MSSDEAQLATLLSDAFGMPWSPAGVAENLTRCASVDAVFVIEKNGGLLATASARLDPVSFPGEGYVHWVGTARPARNQGLGRAVIVAVLRRFEQLGLKSAVLETDDERISAIRLYMDLGFQPVLRHETDAERWTKVGEMLASHKVET